MKFTSVELFTGAGGLALGLEHAGFDPKFMVEWDDDFYKTIRANAGHGGPTHGWPIHHADVRDVSFKGLGEIDLVAGGPPCQPFSIGGKHRGRNDPRDMWPEAIRAVRELCPRAFFFENVRGLARPAFADYLRYIIERLRRPDMVARHGELSADHLRRLARLDPAAGDGPIYSVQVHKINAADYGASQIRHRIVIVGVRRDLGLSWELPDKIHSREALLWAQYVSGKYWERHRIPRGEQSRLNEAEKSILKNLHHQPAKMPWLTVRDAIMDLGEPTRDGGSAIPNHKFQPGARSYIGHTGSPLDRPAKALKAGDHGVPGGENMIVYPTGRVRYFTVRELARLQGFRDDFVFPGSWTETMRQLGNAVPIPMSTALGYSIARLLRGMNQIRTRRAA